MGNEYPELARVGIRRRHGSGNSAHCFREDHELWREILRARESAHLKHGANSIESVDPIAQAEKFLAILVEEVGELAHALTYDAVAGEEWKRPKMIRAEAMDVAAVITAWLDGVDNADG